MASVEKFTLPYVSDLCQGCDVRKIKKLVASNRGIKKISDLGYVDIGLATAGRDIIQHLTLSAVPRTCEALVRIWRGWTSVTII